MCTHPKKKLYVKTLLFGYCLILTCCLFAQPSLKFEHITKNNGLSHDKVHCILQDRQGYLWFGTIYGLNRYDGYSFKVFENVPGDSTSLAINDIVSLYQDTEGFIWIGTSTSVFSRYNPRTETFKNYSLPSLNSSIHHFKEDENGLLWLATRYGLFSFDRNYNKLLYHKTNDSARENVHGIQQDADKDIFWLSTETGIRKFNKKTGSVKTFYIPYPAFTDISSEITHNIIQDKYGDIWMTTSNNGVYRLNPKTEKLVAYVMNFNGTSSATSSVTTQLMEDSAGKIWVGGEGLAFFDYALQQFSFYKTDADNPQGIPARVRALLKDRSGICWVATERGIAKYDPKLYSFTTAKSNPPFTVETANTIIEDRDHKFWVGNHVGLGSIDANTGLYTNENKILGTQETNTLYSSLLDKDGSLWFGSKSCLFHLSKTNSGANYNSSKIVLPVAGKFNVVSLCADDNGTVWTGTKRGGLFRYDVSSKKFEKYTGDNVTGDIFSSTTINALFALSPDSLLIGTEGMGLILMHTKNEKFEKLNFTSKESAGKKNNTSSGIDYSIINAIVSDKKKNIWIGTETGGLWQTDTRLSKFINYSTKNGLQSMNVTQIVIDDLEQIWLNTNIGLEIIDPLKKRFVHYSEKDGLSINQPDYLIKKSSGDLIQIDFNGLHIFHSSSINLNKNIPPVYINQLQVLDKFIPIYNDTVIHLKYFENYVSFGYVALNYTQSFKNRYKYKLEGLDKDWIDAGERRFTSYGSLAPRTYTFLVKGCNNNDIWNETPARLTLIISPPWWNTWWFYALCVLTVIGAMYALFQYRLQQKLKAFELRNTISRDLHDEVGSTLSSIGFISSMALNDMDSANIKTQHALKSISESSHKMLDAMNDIIWSIQPQNDTLNNIIARMISFASEILEARKISLNFKPSTDLTNLHLGVNVRHDFFVIFKEAVNNLAKYSCATDAYIQLEHSHPYIVLIISDNGKGFNPETVKNGNGLRNMQNRAQKIGAQYSLHSVPGKGTTITLKVRAS